MSAISIIAQRLLDSPDVVDIVGDRVFPVMAPQNAKRPYIVLHLIDNDDDALLGGAGRYYRSIVQSDAYSEMTTDGAKLVIRLGDAVIEALNGVVKESIAGCVDIDILLGSVDFTESGLEANTHCRKTQFASRWRTQPGDPADFVPTDLAFTITAGVGGDAVGYAGLAHYAGWGPFGSIDADPISGFPLQGVTRQASTGTVIAFTGDVSALLAGKSLWVDGTNFGRGVQYRWTYVSGVTVWQRITDGPLFSQGQNYSIEIK